MYACARAFKIKSVGVTPKTYTVCMYYTAVESSPIRISGAAVEGSMALVTFLWGAGLAIALVSILVVSLAIWTGGKRSLKLDGGLGGRVLLITAHPDDECMFFAPIIITLTQANVEVVLLCLSEGYFHTLPLFTTMVQNMAVHKL